MENPTPSSAWASGPSQGVLAATDRPEPQDASGQGVANESNANFISIKGPEIGPSGKGRAKGPCGDLKKARQWPRPSSPDEIERHRPRRVYEGSKGYDTLVKQLLTVVDGLTNQEGVTVIAATNPRTARSSAAQGQGRFDRLIFVPSGRPGPEGHTAGHTRVSP